MAKLHRFPMLAALFFLLLAQLACSAGGYSLSREPATSPPAQQEQNPATQAPASLATRAPTLASPVMVKTPTPTFSIEVPPPAAGKSNAVGLVLWNGHPVVGADVRLCEDMGIISGCEGQQASTFTDDQGYYLFQDVEPGEYAVVVHAVDTDRWLYISSALSLGARKATFATDQTLNLGVQQIYKFDLQQTSPSEDERVSQAMPSMKWDPYPEAAYYEIYVSPQSGDSISQQVQGTEYSFTNPALNCEYTWQVEAYNSDQVEIAEHDGYSHFQVVNQPASCLIDLIGPQDGASLGASAIEFSWQAHPMAGHYLLYVSDSDYNNLVDGVQVNGTSYTLTQDLPSADYRWYVAVYDTAGNWIASSPHYDLIVK